jgi:uncharacterized protein (AIM24 family)
MRKTWVLESGSYWALEGALNLSAYREKMLIAFWAGDGLIGRQTKVSGRGKVVLASPGPIEELTPERESRWSPTASTSWPALRT